MPHSILKKPSYSTSATAPSPSRSQEDRNKETALYHAHLLQQRKETEALILSSTEALLDLPSSPTADPARPSAKDRFFVKSSLKLFQPSDYDSLLEERNINSQCGYLLCPRPNRREDTKAKYRILRGNGNASHSLKFVERQALERWCSDDCGKRALYVKVQLNEEPAWTRASTSGGDIVFLEDRSEDQMRAKDDYTLVEKMTLLDISLEEEEEIVAKMKVLAVERGDGRAPSRSFGISELQIRENDSVNRQKALRERIAGEGDADHFNDTIEGYIPKFLNTQTKGTKSHREHEDIMPTI